MHRQKVRQGVVNGRGWILHQPWRKAFIEKMACDQRPKGWDPVLRIWGYSPGLEKSKALEAEDFGEFKEEKGDQCDHMEWSTGRVLEEKVCPRWDHLVSKLWDPEVFGFCPEWDLEPWEGFEHWSDCLTYLWKGLSCWSVWDRWKGTKIEPRD